MPRRLFWSLLVASLALNAMYGAVAGILVPAQIATADPAGKEAALAVTMTASSALTVVLRPVFGMVSDRTRSRFGRRTPFIAGGAIGAAVALVALGQATSVVAIAIGWIIVQPLLNLVEGPLDAVMADRVPPASLPRASAFYGAGIAIGVAGGTVVAGATVSTVGAAYAGLAVVLVVAMVGFVLVERDRPRDRAASVTLPWRRAWASRDLRLVFAARFVLVLGHQLVLGYLLYVVMAFTSASVDEAGGISSRVIGLHIVCLVAGAALGGVVVKGHRVRWIIAASVVIGAALIVPIFWTDLAGLTVYAAIAGVARGVYLTADLALMIDLLPSRADSGRDLGVLGLATTLPQTLAPTIAGIVLVATANDYVVLFALASVLVFASAAVISRVRSSVPSSSR
ncbi:Na+/melibiose symporter-like transporter [Microbacterium sp. AG1240]|uniref:MFS transporter n=1 Tax=Microbacterium sp. AG1240 TaxID=2183992 RepID=UPI000F0E46B5|nr:MFS transporter [Microbacterium sp. AG1240]RKT36102.1 Na+/melibiose symporter-like transporter [Microbacterium sp. AG1240]